MHLTTDVSIGMVTGITEIQRKRHFVIAVTWDSEVRSGNRSATGAHPVLHNHVAAVSASAIPAAPKTRTLQWQGCSWL